MTHVTSKISFKGLDRSDAVEERVREHIARLERLCTTMLRCDVVIDRPHRHHRHGRRFEVRITIDVPGRMIEVSRDPGGGGAHEDVYVAVRDSFLAARRQLEVYVHGTVAAAV